MKKLMLNEREVVDAEIEFSKYVEDTYFSSAYFADTGEELTEAELNDLNEFFAEYLEEEHFMNAIMDAESAYEGDR